MKIFENIKKLIFFMTSHIYLMKKEAQLEKKITFFLFGQVFTQPAVSPKKIISNYFLKVLNKNNYPNLEIDARLFIFAYLNKD